ncbi:unnamed protein product [Meloidogyne enterolobii]|uniref:Uncharacterized protein n=1 Tax=Meloidogyne enterolobii TaxID=390850 RepID=A0ACB0YVF4_MELEN
MIFKNYILIITLFFIIYIKQEIFTNAVETSTKPIKCGQNEEPQKCGCDGTCKNPNPPCKTKPVCGAQRCLCIQRMVGNRAIERLVRNQNNKCVEEKNCKK